MYKDTPVKYTCSFITTLRGNSAKDMSQYHVTIIDVVRSILVSSEGQSSQSLSPVFDYFFFELLDLLLRKNLFLTLLLQYITCVFQVMIFFSSQFYRKFVERTAVGLAYSFRLFTLWVQSFNFQIREGVEHHYNCHSPPIIPCIQGSKQNTCSVSTPELYTRYKSVCISMSQSQFYIALKVFLSIIRLFSR